MACISKLKVLRLLEARFVLMLGVRMTSHGVFKWKKARLLRDYIAILGNW